MVQNIIQLGDIVVLQDGRTYVYLICADGAVNNDCRILVRSGGYFFSTGISMFGNDLIHSRTGDRIIKIYRPESPLTHLIRRSEINYYSFDKVLKSAIQIYPNKNFINISWYV